MKIKFRRVPALFVLANAVAVAGCSSSPPEPEAAESAAQTTGNFYVGSRSVYAHLNQDSGGSWMLRTVSATADSAPEKGYLIRLNDLSPAFDIRVAECEPQAYPANHKCNPAQPFRDKRVGVMGKIISGGIAAGTAGKVTDISRTYETAFDEAAFNQAVDEALTNSGFGPQRRQFLTTLDRYDELRKSAGTELANLRRKALERYQNTANVPLDIRPTINGLTRYYSRDIEFRDIVEVGPGSGSKPAKIELEEHSILPCDARQCGRTADDAINDLRATVKSAKSDLAAPRNQDGRDYSIHCDANSYAGYAFTLKCPDTVSMAGADAAIVPITMNIVSRDFDALYPDIDISDDNLSAKIDNNTILFTNRTTDYLAVTAQTVYYNSQVETRSERIDVAPGATVERPIDQFVTPAIRIEASYPRMTPDKAKGASFQFGFAARYRLAGAAEDTTLYELRGFNVACVIDNRLQPGSCAYPPPADEAALDERQDALSNGDERGPF